MRIRLGYLALLGAALLALTGCLRREPEETITLTWWVTYAADSDEYPSFQAIAEAYTEETGHVVELVSVPWDDIAPRGPVASRLALAQELGTGPDVWGPVPHGWTGVFATEGQAMALETTQIEDLDQYIDVAISSCQFGSAQYALPVLMDSVALIYNKALVSDPPESFEELLDLARNLTDEENDRWGLVFPLLSQYHTYPFIDGYGGYLFKCESDSCDLSDIGLNNEGSVRGVEFLSDLYTKEGLFPEPLADRAVMHSYALHLFTEGKAAMLLDGSWVLPEIRASDVDYGVAVLPNLPGTTNRPRPLSLFQAIYVSAHSAHPEEALDFVNYLAGPESVPHLYQAMGRTPVRRDVLRLPEFREDREIRAWRDQIAAGVPLPNIPELDYVWSPWGRALDAAIPGLAPAQDALDRAVEQIGSYIEEDQAP